MFFRILTLPSGSVSLGDPSLRVPKWGPLFNSPLAASAVPLSVEAAVLVIPHRVTILGGGGSAQLAGSLTSTEPHLPEGAEPVLLSLHPTQIHAHWILLLDLG